MKILTESTTLALWHELVQEAQNAKQVILKTEVESYLVFMLMRFTSYRQLAKEIMALSFLRASQYPTKQREAALQTVGDQCLLISGLFPALAEKRHVKLRYFIEMGKISYEVISQKADDIFSTLSKEFIPVMDVLQSFRPYKAESLPLEIRQIWEDPSK